ncbi:MAG: substrate-binding domain-containing protein [Bacteroidetes bacterium]|nr:substrate-binding domain-containing protein [Bacteroidota bacterium]
MYRLIIILTFGVFIFLGCQESNVTPTKGSVTVEVDPAIFPIVQKERDAFDSLYTKAKVELKEVTPLEGMINLLNNKTRMFVSARYFNQKQLDFIRNQKLDIQINKFCYDAVAIICSKHNKTDQLRVDEIKSSLLGYNKSYTFVIPQNTSATFQYLKEEVLDDQEPKNAIIVQNDFEVLKKIEKSDDLLGIVSFNIVQDSSKINFVQIGQLKKQMDQDSIKGLQISYFTPHPGFLIKNYYPLKQTVYIYLNELGMTPASGFTTFLTSYEGQKIALGQNLAPAAVPVKINE